MKFRSPTRIRLGLVMLAGAFVLFFSACVKTNNNDYYNPPVGFVNVVQASPDEPPLNCFFNNDIVNGRPMQFGDFTEYFRAYTGTRTANFDNAATMGQLISQSVVVNQNVYYSLFLTNTSANPQYLYLTDTLNKPSAGQASIRFVNLSPDAGAVDFTVLSGNTTISNKSFMGHSGFVGLTSGTYSLQVTQTGSNTVLASLTGLNLGNGGLYTIWLQGLKTSTGPDDKLSINSMQNAQY